MTFSLIIPSRGRTNLLANCLASFWNQACSLHRDEIEFVLAVDADDYETLSFINSVRQQYPIKVLVSSFRHNNSKYLINLPAKIAKGKYIWVLNDECLINILCWDIILKLNIEEKLVNSDRIAYIMVGDGTHVDRGIDNEYGVCFPILTREAVEKLEGVFPEEIQGHGADTELFNIFKKYPNRIIDCKHIGIQHISPHNKTRESDLTHHRMIHYSTKTQLEQHEVRKYITKVMLS